MKSFGCTDFILNEKYGSVIVGRSMDFCFDLQSQIVIFPKKEKRVSKIKNSKGFSWSSKYAYIAITNYKSDFVSDGMNEKGLSVGSLWFEKTSYPKISNKNLQKTISSLDLGNYILGCFSCVNEVKKDLKNKYIYPKIIKKLNVSSPLHLSIHDKFGKSIIIEFENHKMKIIDNKIGV